MSAAKITNRDRVLQAIASQWKITKQPMGRVEIVAALKIHKDVIGISIRSLIRSGDVRCVGEAADWQRPEGMPIIKSDASMYAPAGVELPTMVPRVRPAYVRKTAGVRGMRVAKQPDLVAAERYKGVKQPAPYRPEFAPMVRASYDLYAGRNLAMLSR